MANPNLINTTSCLLKTVILGSIATSVPGTTALSSITGKHQKVVAAYFCNTTASTVTIDLYHNSQGGQKYYFKSVDLPGNTTIVGVTKDAPIHFPEGSHTLCVQASASGVDVLLSVEEYDDA